ncbi:P-loop containing nucleoside triphosphate hydrolase protein [Baffinella frigidus]|nr:P-loop containing nucleoside triphosphate hydrolase protein [Cryptophyta sp. CCMP2293]
MVRMATALSRDAPILVEGASGAGKTALIEEAARWCGKLDSLIRIHLDDGMDSKTLIGSYACTETPGEFVWRPGALTQAVLQGRWVLIEDLDLAPLEVLASLIPLLDSRRLFIPARDAVAVARPGFRFLATRATARIQRALQSP